MLRPKPLTGRTERPQSAERTLATTVDLAEKYGRLMGAGRDRSARQTCMISFSFAARRASISVITWSVAFCT
jgi:hypothetical protein